MKTAWVVLLTSVLFWVTGLSAEDRVGDGVDADPGPNSAAAARSLDNPEARPAAPAAHSEKNDLAPVQIPSASEAPKTTLAQVNADPATPVLETPAQPKNIFSVEMEDFTSDGPVSPTAKTAYDLIAEAKTITLQISTDLDAGGKERTRLIQSAEALSKTIDALAKLWPNVEAYRAPCLSAKSRTLTLEEELRAEPRRWNHVRWSFQEVAKEVTRLRRKAAEMAGEEPKLVRVVRKGREYLEEIPRQDPEEIRKAEEERRRKSQAETAKMRKWENDVKKTEEIEIPKH